MENFKFESLTDEQIDKLGLLEQGIYDFEVTKCIPKKSKNSNPMAELQLKIWDKYDVVHFVFDYLVFTKQKLPMLKIKHFCESVGLVDEYLKGDLPGDLTGLTGKVDIGIQVGSIKPEGGFYPNKNVVVDYIKRDPSTKVPLRSQDEFNDDINF